MLSLKSLPKCSDEIMTMRSRERSPRSPPQYLELLFQLRQIGRVRSLRTVGDPRCVTTDSCVNQAHSGQPNVLGRDAFGRQCRCVASRSYNRSQSSFHLGIGGENSMTSARWLHM